MEASALHAPAALRRFPLGGGAAAAALRRAAGRARSASGNDEAFRILHDRYRQRLFAYVRQMLSAGSRQDAEDVLQDVFVRAYGALRNDNREMNVRAWLYRVAHNRCIDHLRRPIPPAAEIFEVSRKPLHDPVEEAQRRDDLRQLVADVGQLPEQQRSALLMREIDGMTYADLANALDVTVPAVKSLLVRARVGLVEAAEARDADCAEIQADLLRAYDRGVKASGRARKHMRSCDGCTEYRGALRGMRRSFAALTPVGLGPLALVAKLIGLGGAAGGGAAAAAAAGGRGRRRRRRRPRPARSPRSSARRRSRPAARSRSTTRSAASPHRAGRGEPRRPRRARPRAARSPPARRRARARRPQVATSTRARRTRPPPPPRRPSASAPPRPSREARRHEGHAVPARRSSARAGRHGARRDGRPAVRDRRRPRPGRDRRSRRPAAHDSPAPRLRRSHGPAARRPPRRTTAAEPERRHAARRRRRRTGRRGRRRRPAAAGSPRGARRLGAAVARLLRHRLPRAPRTRVAAGPPRAPLGSVHDGRRPLDRPRARARRVPDVDL